MPCLWSALFFFEACYVRVVDFRSGAGSDFRTHKIMPQPAAKLHPVSHVQTAHRT
jgi:hypothetical protein